MTACSIILVCWFHVPVSALLRLRQRSILECDRDLSRTGIPSGDLFQWHEKPLVAPDVVLLDVGGYELESHRYAVRRDPVVIVEVLGCLDVVLVTIGPLASRDPETSSPYVFDRVPLIAPELPSFGDEVNRLGSTG